jgi:chemotaxis family two-component system response regulator PixG
LGTWKAQGEITEVDCLKILQNVLAEILFDIVQSGNTQHELHRQERSEPRILPVVDTIEQLITQTKKQWETWLNAELEAYFPDSIPIIKQPEAMRTTLSPQAYQGLTVLLDGKQSLRDIAIRTQRDIFQFTQALKPYIEAGWIELIEEVAVPEFQPRSPSPPMAASRQQTAPMIACIDDSLMICQSMGQVIRAAGYEFISITDAARAINILLQKRPKLIFLDLIMPETNGYEICSQLRKISLFQETPIIILSGNDGLVDQVRARLLGATDFLSKPMEPIVILNIIQKYLGQLALV